LNLSNGIRYLLRIMGLTPAHVPNRADTPEGRPRTGDDDKDIEGVLETFRGLITQLSQDGREIEEICARAGKKAARYALLSEAVIESATSGILVVDETDRVLLANSSAKRILDIEPETDVAGMDMASLFKDGREFRYLISRCRETGASASRKIREVVTLAGTRRRLGVSASCVGSKPPPVEAVMMIFTSLDDDSGPVSESAREVAKTSERQGYLRGVLDSYDLISNLVMDFGRIEAKSNQGVLTTSELRDFSRSIRRTCDIMMAFALSLGVADSIPELVDVNGVLESVMLRMGLKGEPRLRKRFSDALPGVKTIRKVLDVGLGLLIRGCLSQSPRGIEIVTSQAEGDPPGSVIIDVRELGPSKAVARIGDSLREFIGAADMEREAGLFLLSKLPREFHNAHIQQVDGIFHFSMRIGPPIDIKTGHGGWTGDISDRGRDESR
jgi:PAS domain-containing protein